MFKSRFIDRRKIASTEESFLKSQKRKITKFEIDDIFFLNYDDDEHRFEEYDDDFVKINFNRILKILNLFANKIKNVDKFFNKLQKFTAVKNENLLKSTFDEIQHFQQFAQYQNVALNEMYEQFFDESVIKFNNENAAFSEISIFISYTSTSATIFTFDISLFMKFFFRRSFVSFFENTSEFLSHKKSFDVTVFKFILAMNL